MFQIIPANTNYDFIGKAPLWIRISVVSFILALVVLAVKGPNFGLDFTGGHELLIEFTQNVTPDSARAKLEQLKLGETSVQSYDLPGSTKHHFLVRVQRSAALTPEDIASFEQAYKAKFGEHMKRVRHNAEAGDVVELELAATATRAADTSTQSIAAMLAGNKHEVRSVRSVGRVDEPRFQIVLKSIDANVIKAMQELDPAARAVRVEFVGPAVGKQLRNDGIMAVLFALGAILIYVALRFDFFFSPGAVICLFHDAVLVVAFLSLIGEEFSLTTIAAILTLVGYSINDTIIVFDRIRETMGKATGTALKEIVNRSTNETLARTVLTASTTLMACVCLMIFGRGTVLFQFGLIMFIGVIFGTYSSIYVAAPIFIWLRERYGVEERQAKEKGAKKGGSAATPRTA